MSIKERCSAIIFLLIISIALSAGGFRTACCQVGYIYIRADGTIEPSDAPISTTDEITYTLTEDLTGSNLTGSMIVVERNNVVFDGAGHLIQCTLRQNEYPYSGGIRIVGGENVTIQNFEIRGFSVAVEADTPTGAPVVNNKIVHNIIDNNAAGIALTGSGSNNAISENQVINNSNNGISIQWGGGNTITGNLVKNNYIGIILGINSSYNRIFGNRIEGNVWGVELHLPTSNPSNYNTLYHNDFINNTGQITAEGGDTSATINYYDSGFASGGNYWSDYVGEDLASGVYQNETCRDGIGDTPYAIDQNNRDRYPLLTPWRQHLSPPVARFEYTPEIGCALQEVAFNASVSYDLDNNIKSYSWSFADGNATVAFNPMINHTFKLPGFYDVALTVFDEKNLSTAFSRSVRIIASSFISISTTPSSKVAGFAINITGVLEDMFQNPLGGELVLLHYTYEGAGRWFPLISATTDDSGRFETTWFPQATGYYFLKAQWAGDSLHGGTTNTIGVSTTPFEDQYVFTVESNSTLSDLLFDSVSRKLTFTVTGENDTTGYAQVTVAKSLVSDIASLEVRVDGVECNYNATETDDSWVIFLIYSHSSHIIVIELKLQTQDVLVFLITSVLLIVIVISAILIRRRRSRNRMPNGSEALQPSPPSSINSSKPYG